MADKAVKKANLKTKTKQKITRVVQVVSYLYFVSVTALSGGYILFFHGDSRPEIFLGLSLVLLAIQRMIVEKR